MTKSENNRSSVSVEGVHRSVRERSTGEVQAEVGDSDGYSREERSGVKCTRGRTVPITRT